MARHDRLATALLASVLIAGCTSPQKQDRRRLIERTDEARRLYVHATALMANPRYMERSTGRPSPIGRELKGSEIALPTSGPAGDARITDLLTRARDLLDQALGDNPQAPVSAQADARLLLGQVLLARGGFHSAAAEALRVASARQRTTTESLLTCAEHHAKLATFNAALAKMPRTKAEAVRDGLNKVIAATSAEVKGFTDTIAALEAGNKKLTAEATAKLTESRKTRDLSDTTIGPKGLALLTAAQKLEAEANDRYGRVAANQAKIQELKVDRGFTEMKLTAAKDKLAAVAKRLTAMDADGQRASAAGAKAAQDAKAFYTQAGAAAAKVVTITRQAAAQDQQALAAFKGAGEELGKAGEHILAEIRAARKAQSDEPYDLAIHKALADDQHLAGAVAAKASASKNSADIRSRQLASHAANAALSKHLAAVGKAVGAGPPQAAADLAKTLADPAKVRDAANADYQAAEKDLDQIQKAYLTSETGKNTQWMYQTLLAEVYFGHFRLDPSNPKLRDDAASLVRTARAGKEGSPHAVSMVRLAELIQATRK